MVYVMKLSDLLVPYNISLDFKKSYPLFKSFSLLLKIKKLNHLLKVQFPLFSVYKYYRTLISHEIQQHPLILLRF